MKKDDFLSKTIIVWIGALICCFLWGSAIPSIKTGYKIFKINSQDSSTQILFAGIRFIISGVLTILILSISKKHFVLPKRKSISKICILSLLQTIGQYVFFYIGLSKTTGVRSSIIGSLNVFIAIILASIIFKTEKLKLNKIIGCIFGFAGVVFINMSSGEFTFSFAVNGEGFIFMSAVCSALATVIIKIYSKEHNTILLVGYQFLVGGIFMAAFGLFTGGKIDCVTLSGIILLIYMGLISAIAYSLWSILLKYNAVSKVTVFGFMNPVISVILSAIILDEMNSIGMLSLISLFLVSLGIYIVNKEKIKRKNRKV